ncbi:hypothetical protein [Fusobacterium pseudoperiodonticum]|jgi:hypothetical protein|uniref:hypothetical protein n=1 Tax=Fusobacterium pseudoperiodonticum TaxID=2663009 RepID=UPI0030D0BB0A
MKNKISDFYIKYIIIITIIIVISVYFYNNQLVNFFSIGISIIPLIFSAINEKELVTFKNKLEGNIIITKFKYDIELRNYKNIINNLNTLIYEIHYVISSKETLDPQDEASKKEIKIMEIRENIYKLKNEIIKDRGLYPMEIYNLSDEIFSKIVELLNEMLKNYRTVIFQMSEEQCEGIINEETINEQGISLGYEKEKNYYIIINQDLKQIEIEIQNISNFINKRIESLIIK